MTGNSYLSPLGRINKIKGKMLKMTEPTEVLQLGCEMQRMPKNRGDNIIYRSTVPTGGSAANASGYNRWSITASDYQLSEGITPASKSLEYRDVTVQINEFGVLFSYTDKTAIFHEDDIPAHQMRQAALNMGLIREMVRYGVMKAASTVQYSGGLSRSTVDEGITYNSLSLMSRTLMANGAEMKTSILAPGRDYDTSAIEASFAVFCHTDCEHDIRRQEDFVPTAKYANRSVINEHELGSVGRFRFIVSKELNSYPDAGAAIGSTGLKSTTGSNIDVYPMIICGENAVFDVALNDNFEPIHIEADKKTKDDPFGQRGYVGSKFWSAACVVNAGHMGVIEVGVTSL